MEIEEELLNSEELNQQIVIAGLSSILGESWSKVLHKQFSEPYMQDLSSFLQKERLRKTIYPKQEDTFNCFKLTPLEDVNICIIGQDCYPNGEAHGLAFSAKDCLKTPPSLQHIFKAIEETFYNGLNITQDTDLTRWANQGILLLNNVLTVEKGKSGSHEDKGWEEFTKFVIELLNKQDRKICFLCFGVKARTKCRYIDQNKHLVITVEHPVVASYNNRDWEHKDCFKLADNFVKTNYLKNIVW